VFTGHENTLAATLSGSVQRDIYYAKARGYNSALEAALFSDDVPPAVYDNLIIGLTAHARREIKEECLASGMDRVLVKPVQMNDLLTVLEDCFSG
jgi:hypothetical protein